MVDRVSREIRDAIIRKELVPDKLYSVLAISEQLGVSRTPVREALLQLAANGVVRFEPNRGVRVLQVTIKDLEEIYKLRLLLEVPCAFQTASVISKAELSKLTKAFSAMQSCVAKNDEEAFEKHDLVFHDIILRVGGNDRIVEAVRVTRAQMHAKGLSTTPTRTLDAIYHPHSKIYDAIVDRDPVAAALATQEHLLSTLKILVDQSQEEKTASSYEPSLSGWLRVVGAGLDSEP
ncbi:MAG: GntR family transcriptional regulator [Mycobacterium sp.]